MYYILSARLVARGPSGSLLISWVETPCRTSALDQVHGHLDARTHEVFSARSPQFPRDRIHTSRHRRRFPRLIHLRRLSDPPRVAHRDVPMQCCLSSRSPHAPLHPPSSPVAAITAVVHPPLVRPTPPQDPIQTSVLSCFRPFGKAMGLLMSVLGRRRVSVPNARAHPILCPGDISA